MLPESIENLAEKLRFFPGIGLRSSLKMAIDVLQLPQEKFDDLEKSLAEIRDKVKFCENCGFFAQNGGENTNSDASLDGKILCEICKNKSRNTLQICLVEKPTDVITIEKSQVYRGFYHVLNNLISPLDNIFAENTTLSDLVDHRLPELLKLSQHEIELILFFKAGFASQATTAYLQEFLKQKGLDKKVKITRLAQGLPLYYNPDTLDQATTAKALEDRREVG